MLDWYEIEGEKRIKAHLALDHCFVLIQANSRSQSINQSINQSIKVYLHSETKIHFILQHNKYIEYIIVWVKK